MKSVKAARPELDLSDVDVVIELIGGGPRRGRRIRAVLSGVSNALMTPCRS